MNKIIISLVAICVIGITFGIFRQVSYNSAYEYAEQMYIAKENRDSVKFCKLYKNADEDILDAYNDYCDDMRFFADEETRLSKEASAAYKK